MNPFMPDRGELVDARHIPWPPQGDTLISAQSTPPDFTPVDADPMKAVMWNSDPQPSHHIPVPWNPVDATETLMNEGIVHDMLGTIPRVADFSDGPGDKMPGNPGWM